MWYLRARAPGLILVGERGKKKIGVSLDRANQADYDRFVENLKLLLTAPPDGDPSGRLFIVGCSVMTGAKGNASACGWRRTWGCQSIARRSAYRHPGSPILQNPDIGDFTRAGRLLALRPSGASEAR